MDVQSLVIPTVRMAANIILKGSKVHELHSYALTIFDCLWIPREQNTQADY
jgi:hypothetical protein